MDFEKLSEEKKAKLRECNSLEELEELAEEEGYELSEEILDSIAGGNCEDDGCILTTVEEGPVIICPQHTRRQFRNWRNRTF